MNKTAAEASQLASETVTAAAGIGSVDAVLCPPFTAIDAVRDVIAGTDWALGAQNVHWEPSGAYTGEISAAMLRQLDCAYVIVGHSERRTYFGDTDELVNRKARAVLQAGMRPIVCVGETLEQRERDETEDVVRRQVEGSLEGLGSEMSDVVIAYEPVWAIGTGRTATAGQAQSVHAHIRKTVAAQAGADAASGVRIQYGGSVKPSNASELFGQEDIDGGLIGGAALDAQSFAAIVAAATGDPT